MADIYPVTDEHVKAWADWAEDRPAVIQALAERFKPWKLYRLLSSGHRVTVQSFFEDGTLTVAVLGKYNLVNFERAVFGIDPDDLVECDLPAEGEPLGVKMNEQQTLDYINARRVEHGLGRLTQQELDRLKADNNGVCAIGADHEEAKH